MSKFEYMEVELHGESGTNVDGPESPRGEGTDGYIAKLNAYGAKGWHVVNVDVDTHAHVRFILEREIEGGE